ncbi:MAG: phospholipid carrier-dependent glycosyltransferase [Leptolyngbyaceae cyanobacterium CSU_1_3]|nr:phospholipid carrier-dependent glycosyltransferase [Leptolyngbyaceae cyanobacterium CSU_1_3]
MHAIALAFTLVIALVLRLFRLSENPVSLNQDEAVNGYDAYSLGLTMRDHHGNFLPPMLESFGDWASPTITYLTVPFVKLFGLSEWAIRLPIALLGIATIVLIYIFTVQIFNRKKLGLLAAFLLTIMPWHITLSRWAIPPCIVPFFLLLFAVAFLWAVDRKGRGLEFAIVGFLGAILTYAYPTQKMFVPLFLAAISWVYLRKHLVKGAIVWVTYLALVAPMHILSLSDPARYNARFSQVSIISPEYNAPTIVAKFVIRYIRYFSPDFNFGAVSYDFMHQVPSFGSTYEFLSIFFYLGILNCIYIVLGKEKLGLLTQKKGLFLLAWLLIAPIPASLTRESNHVLRMIHFLPLVIVFVILGMVTIVQAINNTQLKKVLVAVIVILGLFNTASFANFYFRKYPDLSKEAFQYGIKDFMSYAIEHQDKFEKIVVDTEINQPYIYYLFHSKYDPRLINHDQVEQKNSIKTIGKYEFRKIVDRDLANAQEIYKVEDTRRVLYRAFERDRILVIKKEPNGLASNRS